jgi:diacylglycerol kinase family enzyme
LIAIVINPIAGGVRQGRAHRRAELASAILTSCGEESEVFISERKGHVRELAAAAVARGARLVIAWGGDGTMNEAASAVMSTPAALGLVPAGSGNGLARELGVDFRPERAIRDALSATPRVIDAGELGGRPFFSVAGVGFDAHVAACLDVEGGRRGFPAYARITARELWSYRPGHYQCDADDRPSAILITLANSAQFGNGARIAPDAKLDDGLLDLVVFEERTRLHTVWALPRLFMRGGVTRLPGFSVRKVERTVIESSAPMTFHVDGEPVRGGTRLEGRVLPGVLKVCVR